MTTLCVFRSSEFGAGKAGFMSAMNDGAVYDVDSDNSDCSYGNMYNVQNMAAAVAKCLGQDDVEIGAYRTINGELEYVSLSEMDNTTHHVENSYDSLESGFDDALKARSEQQSNVDTAFKMFAAKGVILSDVSDMKIDKVIAIGRELGKQKKSPDGSPLTYDDERALWVGKPDQPTFEPNIMTGRPVFK
jgi:hypothetical protein